MSIRRPSLALGLICAALFAGSSGSAHAANTRVSISDFTWSKNPTVNLGESVTWDWLGPDLQHSVTGQEPNATQWDSDPGTASPRHNAGNSFTVTFDQPGSYLFVCKLHPQAVRGTVTVTDLPGDPNSDPGPQAPLRVDLEPPLVNALRMLTPVLGPKGKGALLQFETGERGTASIDYYRIIKQKRGGKIRSVRRFAGYHEAPVHVGINEVKVAYRSSTFKAKPGKYRALFRVDDENNNPSPTFPVDFEIKGKKKPKKK